MALAWQAAAERPSPMTTCTWGGWSMTPRMVLALCSSKQRPRSGRVKYSSLLSQRVLVGSKLCFFANSVSTSENTASWAAAWSARKRSIVRVLYRGPAFPEPSRAGVRCFILAKRSLSAGSFVKYSFRRSSAVMSGTKSPSSKAGQCFSGWGWVAWYSPAFTWGGSCPKISATSAVSSSLFIVSSWWRV